MKYRNITSFGYCTPIIRINTFASVQMIHEYYQKSTTLQKHSKKFCFDFKTTILLAQ